MEMKKDPGVADAYGFDSVIRLADCSKYIDTMDKDGNVSGPRE